MFVRRTEAPVATVEDGLGRDRITGRVCATRSARLIIYGIVLLSLGSVGTVLADPPGVVDGEGEPPRVSVHGLVDVRVVASDEDESWLAGGLGRTRYSGVDRNRDLINDRRSNAFHLGQLSLVVRGRVADEVDAIVHLNAEVEAPAGSSAQVGIVESFILWHPVLAPNATLRLRAGVTIPPFSLEHLDAAWSTRFTITPSAIGSWIGEELRSTGVEGTVIVSLPRQTDLELQAAAFSGNDPTGALLAWRGWALHDRQSQVGEELPLPPVLSLRDERFFAGQGARTEPFMEIDGEIGYHVQVRLRSRRRGQLQFAYYDNRGDLAQVDLKPPMNYAWDTTFLVAGAQLNAGPLMLMGQYVDGRARMGPALPIRVDAPFRAAYGMASLLFGGTRLTFRYDDFAVGDADVWKVGKDLNEEDGWATTVAVIRAVGKHQRLHLEHIHLNVDRPFAVTAGGRSHLVQDQLQAGYRVIF